MFSSFFETIGNLSWYGKVAVVAGALGTVAFVGYLTDPGKKDNSQSEKDAEETKIKVLEFKLSKLTRQLDQLEDSINEFTISLKDSKKQPSDIKQQAAFFSESLLQLVVILLFLISSANRS